MAMGFTPSIRHDLTALATLPEAVFDAITGGRCDFEGVTVLSEAGAVSECAEGAQCESQGRRSCYKVRHEPPAVDSMSKSNVTCPTKWAVNDQEGGGQYMCWSEG